MKNNDSEKCDIKIYIARRLVKSNEWRRKKKLINLTRGNLILRFTRRQQNLTINFFPLSAYVETWRRSVNQESYMIKRQEREKNRWQNPSHVQENRQRTNKFDCQSDFGSKRGWRLVDKRECLTWGATAWCDYTQWFPYESWRSDWRLDSFVN